MLYKIIPGILRTNESDFLSDCKVAETFTDLVQIDVLDGLFTPQRTVQADVIHKYTGPLQLEIQILTNTPDHYIGEYLIEKVTRIIVPIETLENATHMLEVCHQQHKEFGVSINPETDVEKLRSLGPIDMITVMSVTPGAQGQLFQPEVIDKIRQIRSLFPTVNIEIDGGMTDKTLPIVKQAGANMFVAGSYIFGSENQRERFDTLQKLL